MHTRPFSPALQPKPPSDERPLAYGFHCPAQGRGYLFAAYEKERANRFILIGRGRTCDIRFDDPYLSKVHAMIKHRTDHSYTLRDNLSDNGVFVDGVRISQPITLRVGMRIRMGRIELIATSESGSLPIEASTITGFARKAPSCTARAPRRAGTLAARGSLFASAAWQRAVTDDDSQVSAYPKTWTRRDGNCA